MVSIVLQHTLLFFALSHSLFGDDLLALARTKKGAQFRATSVAPWNQSVGAPFSRHQKHGPPPGSVRELEDPPSLPAHNGAGAPPVAPLFSMLLPHAAERHVLARSLAASPCTRRARGGVLVPLRSRRAVSQGRPSDRARAAACRCEPLTPVETVATNHAEERDCLYQYGSS